VLLFLYFRVSLVYSLCTRVMPLCTLIEHTLLIKKKSTLSNMSTYFMSLFLLPVGVANHIEKLQPNFL
jgi:hypothetical protein